LTAKRRARPIGVIRADVWRAGLGPCIRGCESLYVDAHHVITAQKLRHFNLHDHLMDHRNRLALCRPCHDAHHNRKHPVMWEELPPAAIEFAQEVGLLWWLEKHYPKLEAA
jgi:hypothetical protein